MCVQILIILNVGYSVSLTAKTPFYPSLFEKSGFIAFFDHLYAFEVYLSTLDHEHIEDLYGNKITGFFLFVLLFRSRIFLFGYLATSFHSKKLS